ncbi:MAG: DUF1810 domain-containing protein [Albidovulum sp.]
MSDLSRFLQAQEGSYAAALAELTTGRKVTHWMWFIFPQLAGLGRSATARFYGIADLEEARDYLADPVLHGRLDACADALLSHEGLAAEEIMGSIDALKLRSSATLFAAADPGGGTGQRMKALIARYYGGQACALTLDALGR